MITHTNNSKFLPPISASSIREFNSDQFLVTVQTAGFAAQLKMFVADSSPVYFVVIIYAELIETLK